MKSTLAIIHFSPLEWYPPVQNLIKQLPAHHVDVYVYSTWSSTHVLSSLNSPASIRLVRMGKSGSQLIPGIRYFNYVYFYLGCLLKLILQRPHRILYYETLSSWPAIIYKRFFNSKCELLIHYHEYTSPKEYETGMRLAKYFHSLEKKIYPKALWISHTNQYRMDTFQKDILPVRLSNPQIVPNYPPSTWESESKKEFHSPLRIVYVGALSISTMYTREFAQWVMSQNGKVTWDIYSYNHSSEAIQYLHELQTDWIRLHSGVDYDQLPQVLTQYDVGVILYNGHIPNYVWNSPNKLFEYLACGLSVWFPNEIIGSHEYIRETGYPKVLSLDFLNLERIPISNIMSEVGQKNEFTLFCEDALSPLINKFCYG